MLDLGLIFGSWLIKKNIRQVKEIFRRKEQTESTEILKKNIAFSGNIVEVKKINKNPQIFPHWQLVNP